MDRKIPAFDVLIGGTAALIIAVLVGTAIYDAVANPNRRIPMEDFIFLAVEYYAPCRQKGGTVEECKQVMRNNWPR